MNRSHVESARTSLSRVDWLMTYASVSPESTPRQIDAHAYAWRAFPFSDSFSRRLITLSGSSSQTSALNREELTVGATAISPDRVSGGLPLVSHLNRRISPPGGSFATIVIEGRTISASSNGWNSPKSTIETIRVFAERYFLRGAPKAPRTQLPEVMKTSCPPGRRSSMPCSKK